jgi:hypothetical protein
MSTTVSHAWSLRCTLVLDPVDLSKVQLPEGQSIVSVHAYAAGRPIVAELNISDLKRALAAVARTWPLEQAIDVTGDLSAGNVIRNTSLSISTAPEGRRIRPHRARPTRAPRRTKAVPEVA